MKSNMMTKLVLSAFAVMVLLSYASAQDKKVKLDVKLPKPMFAGTPKPVKSDNLEKKAPGAKRADFMVPAGTKNISMDKAVTGSDTMPVIGDLDLITDDDKEGCDGSYVELAPMKQYVQIDLEGEYSIYAIVVWHYHSESRAYRDVVVQVASDADFLTGVKTVFNNDHDNSAGLGVGKDKEWIETYQGKLIDAKGEKGKYIRLYSNGSTADEMNHYIEVSVYGKSAK